MESNRYVEQLIIMDSHMSNPGKKLRDYLMSLYPTPDSNSKQFLQMVDDHLMADGELTTITYQSVFNYLVRRLIHTAEYFRRIYDPKDYGEARYQRELRQYLQDYTRYRDRDIDEIQSLIIKCLKVREKFPTNNVKRNLKRKHENQNGVCSICGRSLDFSKNSQGHLAATVDHVWPHSLGGISELENLAVVCQNCNNRFKKDKIDFSDYHYEQIALVTISYDEYETKAKRRAFEIAVFAKSNFRCVVCDQPAYRVGELYIGRKEPSDSWHYFNLAAYCFEHRPQE